ncbi:MAG: alanine--tRNA ligase [Candidatus Saccharibacteria bacterium]
MNTQQIRQAYLEYFSKRNHVVIKRAPLILHDDPTTLFTGSGMQPLLPYLLGEKHPKGTKLVDSQTCFRGNDLEDVGDNRHTTFFEMLGNWSMGEYFKKEQIRWFFEFLVKVVGLDPNKIYVTCFIGNEKYNIPRDDEAALIWQELFKEVGIDAKIVELGSAENGDEKGMQGGRIFFYDDNENWWSRGGGLDKTPIGDPCGPDSEVFYDFGEANHDSSYGMAHPASDSGRFMEIGNQVFMQYRREEDGSFSPLKQKNVDFGGGLERIAAAKLDTPDVFKNSLFLPIIEKLETLSGKKYESNLVSMRVIADHLRAAVFLGVDGATPSNKEQGYVMRRLIRRAVRYAFDLGIEQNFLEEIVPVIASMYREDYPEVKENESEVIRVLVKEEKVFRQTLRKGLRELEKLSKDKITGKEIFTLYDTYGFPAELSVEEVFKREYDLEENWRDTFDREMTLQKERSKTAAKGVFKGGLAGHDPIHIKYHTLTHMMYQAIRMVLGTDIMQHGSNITAERLRFDFNYPRKVTKEELDEIERIVNEKVKEDLPVSFKEYDTKEAFKLGAIGAFGDRYGDTVKVYQIGPDDNRFSFEICGGPHVSHTGEIAEGGKIFKIKKEGSSSAGIRRIKAVLE